MDLQYNLYVSFIYFTMFLFGAVVGSFLNVCIYRLPKEESLIKSNSHCMTCGTPILKRDLIPILSWCLLRGKCRACGAPISPRYTIVEALNAVGWVLIGLRFDMVSGSGFYAILCCLVYSALLVVFFMDWDTQLISTYVVIFIALVGVLEAIFTGSRVYYCGLSSQIIGIFVGAVPLLLIFLISKGKAMGLGDVYLMAAAGFFLGYERIIAALFLGFILGAVGGLIMKRINSESVIAFGPWLSIGILIAIVYGWEIVNIYVNTTGLGELLHGEGYISNLPGR